MYNLLEYTQNYCMTSWSLWNYYRDEINDVNDNASDGEPFKYETKIIGKSPARPSLIPRQEQPPPNPDESQPPRPERPVQPPVPALNVEVIIPLKYLSHL